MSISNRSMWMNVFFIGVGLVALAGLWLLFGGRRDAVAQAPQRAVRATEGWSVAYLPAQELAPQGGTGLLVVKRHTLSAARPSRMSSAPVSCTLSSGSTQVIAPFCHGCSGPTLRGGRHYLALEPQGRIRPIALGTVRFSDTLQTGTMGCVPPEQYGSAHTDLRAGGYATPSIDLPQSG